MYEKWYSGDVRRNPSLESKTSMATSIISTTTNKMSEISNLEIDMPVDLASDQPTMEQMDVLQRRYWIGVDFLLFSNE